MNVCKTAALDQFYCRSVNLLYGFKQRPDAKFTFIQFISCIWSKQICVEVLLFLFIPLFPLYPRMPLGSQ